MSYEVPRTEDMSTVLLMPQLGRDPNPFIARHNRPIPGEAYSSQEYELLKGLATTALSFTPVPTAQQLERIRIRQESGCWELHTHIDTKGRARYGSLAVEGIDLGNSNIAHRVMYLVFYGPDALPNGSSDWLDHLCENKACCYPRHLELVTPAVNTGRARWVYVDGQIELNYSDTD